MPALRRREGGYAGLCAIVCGQQLSTASAARDPRPAVRGVRSVPSRRGAARARRQARAARPVGAKIKSIKAIGTAIAKGQIDLDAVAAMEADEAHAALTALHGIGPWTADIYLLFCLGNADAWPAGDLALQEAARIAFGLKQRPDAKAMIKLAEPWRPWRGVAAHLLWAYYHAVKRREGAPVQVPVKPDMARREGEIGGKNATKKAAKKTTTKPNGAARDVKHMAGELDGPRLEAAAGRRSGWWCSCTATAPTATT